ncbi:recombinase family protein [Cereibacter sphaeroides]|uniref:recombinase family protein n=1 Tax=Cereibacter sphaeroides TaxID=1063 RepID=UPI001F1CA4D9|nr:recombinase family protein [Cereibacter sphaeroides]
MKPVKRLLDMLRSADVLVVRWMDYFGRNYQEVTDTIREFMRRGVIIRTVINGMVFDGATRDPMQQAVRDALIAFGGNSTGSGRGHQGSPEGGDRGGEGGCRTLPGQEAQLRPGDLHRRLRSSGAWPWRV